MKMLYMKMTTTVIMRLIALLFLLCSPLLHSPAYAEADATSAIAEYAANDDPVRSYEIYRATETKSLTANKPHLAEHPQMRRFLDAMAPADARYTTPLKLIDKKVIGNSATLQYQAVSSDKDLSVEVDLTKGNDGKWTVKTDSFSGKTNDEMNAAVWKNITAAYPTELAALAACGVLLLVATLVSWVAQIWLIVVAFRVSIVWGLCSLFVPFAAIAFAIVHWQKAKKAFITVLAAAAASFVGVVTPIGIFAAEGGFDAMKPSAEELNAAKGQKAEPADKKEDQSK